MTKGSAPMGSMNSMPKEHKALTRDQLQRKANACKKEVLLHLLTSRHCAPRAPYLAKVFRKGETSARARFRDANLVGIGFGVKETHGGFTGDLAVRVYVTEKLPKWDLPRQHRVPDSVNGISTDVIAVGNLALQSSPAEFGASIRHVAGGPGSLGCVLAMPGDSSWYLLSACHILAPVASAKVGDQILEIGDAGAAPLATLADFEPLKIDGLPNRIDAAVAKIARKTDVALRISGIGAVRSDAMEPVLFESVRKYGAVSLHTLGIVTDVAADVTFTNAGEEYFFDDVVQITGCGDAFSMGGDSGALVVDALSSRPVCLVIGGAGVRTYASPLGRILARFNAQIAQGT